MKKTIIHYSLSWNLDSNQGQIILQYRDGNENVEKKITELDALVFNALGTILTNGKALFDTADNTILNIA